MRLAVPLALLAAGWLQCAGAAAVLEEVEVTASKRGGISAQDAVGSIRALSGDFLEQHNLRSFEDIGRLEPSLQFSKAAVGDLQPIIRGIQSPGAGTVGVYFDETIITGINFQEGGGRTPDIAAYDIARVEILKGPQGTTFGASSLTGTVRYISNKPDADGFDASLRVGGDTLEEGDAGYAVDGMINIPVIDGVLALRGVGWRESRGGFLDQFAGLNAVTFIEDADEVDRTGGRVMARYTPTSRLTVDAYSMIQEIDLGGPKGFTETIADTGVGVPIELVAGPPFVVGLTAPALRAVAGDRIVTSPSRAESENRVYMYGATLEYDLGFGSVVVTASDYNTRNTRTEDTTFTAHRFGADLDNFFATGQLTPSTVWPKHQYEDRGVFQTEIRFSSDFDGPFNFVAGFFYQDDERQSEFLVTRGDPVSGETLCAKHSECIADVNSAAAQSVLFATDVFEDVESFALFGNAEIKIAPKWTVGGGIRYFETDEDDRSLILQAFQGSIPFTIPPANGGPVQTTPIVDFEGSTSASEVTWEASLAHDLTDNDMVYFKAAKGFRQGGINKNVTTAAQLGIEIPPDFDPDTVVSLEVGAKTSWYEERLFLNLTYFKMFWDDVQVLGQVFDTPRQGIVHRLRNRQGAPAVLLAQPQHLA